MVRDPVVGRRGIATAHSGEFVAERFAPGTLSQLHFLTSTAYLDLHKVPGGRPWLSGRYGPQHVDEMSTETLDTVVRVTALQCACSECHPDEQDEPHYDLHHCIAFFLPSYLPFFLPFRLHDCFVAEWDIRVTGCYFGRRRRRSSKSGLAFVGAMVVFTGSSAPVGAAWAQTKPTPVKAAAADTVASTRVVAGSADPAYDTVPGPTPTTLKQRVASSTSTRLKVRLAAASLPTADDILANRSIVLSDRARSDIRAGVADPRLLGTLAFMAKKFPIEVTTIRTGHSRYVKGTNRDSNHFYGRAADIGKVDGVPVSRNNQSALSLANYLLTLPGDVRPTELGSPWFGDGSGAAVDVFSDEGHDDHLHIGFDE